MEPYTQVLFFINHWERFLTIQDHEIFEEKFNWINVEAIKLRLCQLNEVTGYGEESLIAISEDGNFFVYAKKPSGFSSAWF